MSGSDIQDTGRQAILVVDDSEINRIITEAVLTSAGYAVDCVSGGDEALQALETRDYELVLMDMDMPGLDGCAATRAIRLGRAGGTRIAALTSCTRPTDRDRARDAGMDAHFGRPLAPHDLLREIKALFAGPRAPRPDSIWQRGVYDHLVARLGEARMCSFLGDLLKQCQALLDVITFNGPAIEDDTIDRTAHDLASTSGMLGFQHLSDCCRDVLQASRTGARTDAMPTLVGALTQVIATLHAHLAVQETIAA